MHRDNGSPHRPQLQQQLRESNQFQEKLKAAMAYRRFFAYDPYDYYYAAPYHYPYPYYQYQQPAPSRGVGGFFTDAAPEAVSVAPRPRVQSSRPVSIPVHFVGSDPEPKRGTARMPPAPRKRSLSAEEAAVRVQAAARGFLARRSVRVVRDVEREADEVAGKIAREAEALRGDARARIAVAEALMRLLLRLDAVRGAREYRRRVTKRVLVLQDAVDALEAKPAPAAVGEDEAEMADESAGPSELPGAVEHGGEIEAKAVAGDRAVGEPEVAEQTEQAQDGANLDGHKPEGSDAEGEGEWGMVMDEPVPATETPAPRPESPKPQEPAGTEIRSAAEAGAAAGDGGLDARKVMEMVAALCERNAQQCAVIGALAERVEALERAVRRVEDAERRRRRGKKARKEGKGSNHNKCHSDCGTEM